MSQLAFAQTFQIEDGTLTPNGITQANNGDYVIAGRLSYKEKSSSAFAIRIQPSGLISWERVYSSAFGVYFQAVTEIANGNLVATGDFSYSGDAQDQYIWVVILDAQGDIIWQRAFGDQNALNQGYDVVATKDGGFVVTGLVTENNETTTWVLKFDAEGVLEWERRFDGGAAYSIIQTMDGGYALSGAQRIPDSLNSYPYVLRLDPDGDIVWERVYTEFEIFTILDTGITETKNGHFVVAVKSVILELDACGNIVWVIQDERFNLDSVVQTPNGDYAVGGALLVSFIEHTYVVVIDPITKLIRWDNTEISYSSVTTQIIINQDGYVTGTGYVPRNVDSFNAFLAIYFTSESI